MRHGIVLIALLGPCLLPGDGAQAGVPGKPDPGLEIDFQVEFALENGPVAIRVGLTNRSDQDREYVRVFGYDAVTVRVAPVAGWRANALKPLQGGAGSSSDGPHEYPLRAGASVTEFVALQDRYQRIPAGRFDVQVEWPVLGPANRWAAARRSEKSWDFAWQAHTIFLQKRQSIRVLPATPTNVEAARKKLEGWINEAEARPYPWASLRHPYAAEVVQALSNSRHPEFVPLVVRVLQWEKSGFDTHALCNTVYDSHRDPTAGYAPLRSLYTEGTAATAKVILDYWWHQESYHSGHQYRLRTLNALRAGKPIDKHLGTRFDLIDQGFMQEVAHWSDSRAHPNSRLTPDQHRDLQGLENVWLRTAYWQRFPTYCPPFWAARLFSDLKRAVALPDDKVVRAIGEGLGSDRYPVRERASREAMALDDRIMPALREYARFRPSAETTERLAAIARHFEAQPLSPLGKWVVDLAVEGGQTEGAIVFRALADPTSGAKLAAYAVSRRADQEKQFNAHEAWRKRQREEETKHKAAGKPD